MAASSSRSDNSSYATVTAAIAFAGRQLQLPMVVAKAGLVESTDGWFSLIWLLLSK